MTPFFDTAAAAAGIDDNVVVVVVVGDTKDVAIFPICVADISIADDGDDDIDSSDPSVLIISSSVCREVIPAVFLMIASLLSNNLSFAYESRDLVNAASGIWWYVIASGDVLGEGE